MNNKSVLISGAGIAGPTLAYWLKAAGFEPTLVEHAPAPRTGGYVIDFWGLGYDIAERMGLGEKINRVGYHMREMRIVDGAGARIAGFGTGVFSELTGGRYVTLGRSDLSRLLLEKAGGVETRFGNEIASLREDADGVQVTFKHAQERHYDLLIGADGLHSNVRRLAFGPQEQYEHTLGYVVAAFEVNGYRPRDEQIYLLYGRPGYMVGRFALHSDRTLFLLVFADADGRRSRAHDLPAQKRVLHEVYGDGQWECAQILAALDRAPDLYFDRVSQIRMPNWSRGRIALVGDAAFCVSLMAGQGSALAMTAAYVLAGELARAEGRYEEAFACYEALLRDFIAGKQKGAERFAGALAPKTDWGLFVRNQVARLFNIPGLARLSFGRDIADMLELPRYRWPAL